MVAPIVPSVVSELAPVTTVGSAVVSAVPAAETREPRAAAVDDFNQLVAFDRDPATNLTVGGIRLPAVAVPIATLDGNRSDLEDAAQGPGGGCYFSGAYDRWNHDTDPWDGKAGLDPSPDPEPDLLTLYPTHDDYVRKITTASVRSVEAGHLLPEDAINVVLEAVRTPVP